MVIISNYKLEEIDSNKINSLDLAIFLAALFSQEYWNIYK